MKQFKYALMFIAVAVCGCLVSCGGGDDEEDIINYSDIEMVAGDEYKIPSGSGWTSSNDYVATVSGRNLSALRVGTARIYNSVANFEVTVEPNYYTYMEPYMKWGASKSSVKSYMKGYTIYSDKTELLSFNGEYKELLTMYSFENSKLSMSCVACTVDDVTAEELSYYLDERYVYLGDSETSDGEPVLLWSTIDGKNSIVLMLSVLDSGTIMYMMYYMSASRSCSLDECVAMTAEFATPLKDKAKINKLKELLENK